jgi:hypothetical protein
MDSFYWIVLSIATLMLIVALAYVGWVMGQTKKGYNFPQFTTTCPDNWISTKVGDTVVCQRPATGKFNYGLAATSNPTVDNDLTTYLTNTSSVGYIAPSGADLYINPNDPNWAKDGDAVCEKRAWARKYELKWDSVENANYC